MNRLNNYLENVISFITGISTINEVEGDILIQPIVGCSKRKIKKTMRAIANYTGCTVKANFSGEEIVIK